MELIEAIYKRRAVRDFTDKSVTKEALMSLLNAAVHAPSAMNTQPWAFVVVQNRERLKDCSDRAKAHLLMSLAPGSPLNAHREVLADPATSIFYNAGTLVIICAKPQGLDPAEDCALAAQNLMLAAHAAGLATCPIGLARAWLNVPEVKQELGIPPDYTPVFPLIVGFPATTPPAVARRDPEIVKWI